MAHVALVFPPGSDPRSPYLALPCLAAHLRKSGISVSLHDLDIGGVRYLLEPRSLEAAIRRLKRRRRVPRESPEARLIGISEALAANAEAALAVFRDPQRFFEPPELNAARDVVLDCLDLHSAATNGKVQYSINPVKYDIEGVDPQSSADLCNATRDNRWNLFSGYWEETLFPALARRSPVAVGITITNRQQMIPGLMLARRLRERGHFVVLGGALLTKFVSTLRQMPEFFRVFADSLIAYEGETALVGLVEALEKDRDLSRIPNLLYLDRGQVRMNPTHVEDVGALPCPDFEGLPLGSYLTPFPVLPIYFGKGCYFNRCKFCDIPYINHISKKPYRLRSVEALIDDLFQLKQRFGCRHFEFTDESLPPRNLEQLADAINENGWSDLNFVGYARLEPGFTRETCRKLAGAGVRKLFFGLESGAQQTLDHMDKGIQLSDVPQVLSNCAHARINFHIFSIVGFPEETEDLARETYRFFEANSAVIDSPGNSFDIHAFGLEFRTAYTEFGERFGIQIAPSGSRKDFVIGPGEWTYSRGLSHEAVERLLAEFNDGLRKIYSCYHAGPDHLWPGFEEFSVLYAEHYRCREFPYRSSLPEETSLGTVFLRWNPAVWIDRRDPRYCFIRSRYGGVGLVPESFELINDSLASPGTELIDLLSGEADRSGLETRTSVIALLNEWLSIGLLQLLPYRRALGCAS